MRKSVFLRLLLFDRNSNSGSCKFLILYSGSICHKGVQLLDPGVCLMRVSLKDVATPRLHLLLLHHLLNFNEDG